jgi:cysteamine dioxygenase
MSDDAVTNSSSCVRYLHIAEISDQYSIGIFVFAPFARIPLHDHPDMCVLSRVLYGDLKRHSLDLARREDMEGFHDDSRRTGRRKSWLGGWFGSSRESQSQKLPEGTKRAFKNHVDHLEAPGVTALYPYEGNLHEFIAGPHGAAVLDVLLPPYDNFQNRDCTFYEIHHLTSQSTKGSGREPCYVVPTGQPENFHCISGRFGDLGEEDFE